MQKKDAIESCIKLAAKNSKNGDLENAVRELHAHQQTKPIMLGGS